MAPSGCLQYFRSPSAVIKSFNYGPKIEDRSRYLSNLRYTSCIRVEEVRFDFYSKALATFDDFNAFFVPSKKKMKWKQNFCAVKWETENEDSFSFGAPTNASIDGSTALLESASGESCSKDDFVGIDQGSLDGVGPGEDRFCGNRLLNSNVIISRSKPFQLKVRSNHDQALNAASNQQGFSLRYVQLPCVI